MIDIDKIGYRIWEQRKCIMKLSQEKMAEDLNMYQADISNMEKAKSGSGITDLIKLDLIADYFNIPLETLLFGGGNKNMLIYSGEKMKLKESKKKMLKNHREFMKKLTGRNDEEEISAMIHVCGPYTIYTMIEKQMVYEGGINSENTFALQKTHTYVFLESELIGVMVADITNLMQHIFQPHLVKLQMLIQRDILDVTDVLRTLNPYWGFWMLAENEDVEQLYFESMIKRMDELRNTGQERPVLYIENVYVREDCRQHGIFRLYIDLLKLIFGESIMWLNMEPTSGSELNQEYECVPSYSVSELGQLNINAAIAEKVGFTVDPDTWHRQTEMIDPDGNVCVETVLVRKCAYYLPKEIRELLKNDGDLVEKGRAKQKLKQSPTDVIVDLKQGYRGNEFIAEIKISEVSGHAHYVSVIVPETKDNRYVVSYSSFLRDKTERIITEFASLQEAENSEYYNDLKLAEFMANRSLGPKDECTECEIESFDYVNDVSYIFSDENSKIEVLEVTLKRSNTDQAGEVVYAYIQKDDDGSICYAINKKSIQEVINGEMEWLDDLDMIVGFESREEMIASKYFPLFKEFEKYI